jgi:hypothetical protein
LLLLISFASDGVDRGVFRFEGWAQRSAISCFTTMALDEGDHSSLCYIMHMAARATGSREWRYDFFRSRDRATIDRAVMQSREQCKESYNQTNGKKGMQYVVYYHNMSSSWSSIELAA